MTYGMLSMKCGSLWREATLSLGIALMCEGVYYARAVVSAEYKQTQPFLYLPAYDLGGLRVCHFGGVHYNPERSNTWSVEAMKIVAKYENVGEPQR